MKTEPLLVRLPLGMKARLAASSQANNRSMNGQIVSVLDQYLPKPIPQNTIEKEEK